MQRGFSLVELSIVLVILGLLVGGILAGQSLIRAAELRAVGSEHQRFRTALYSFRDKYFALAGDMPNAVSFWGQAAAGNPCATTQGTGTQTCNGDGDGKLEHSSDYTGSSEQFRLWQHLANAGLIEGSYSGIEGSTGNLDHAVGGTNVPRSKLPNAIWMARFISGGTWALDKHWLLFGTPQTNNLPGAVVLKPEEAWNVDTKLDDGRPGLGRIHTYQNATTCATTTSASTAQYALTSTAIGCSLMFMDLL